MIDNFTKSREFIKEAEPPGPDCEGHGVGGQSEGHLGSVGQQSLAELRHVGTLIGDELPRSGYEHGGKGVLEQPFI